MVGGNAAFDQFFANIYASDDGGSTWRDLTSASATATGKKVRSEKSRVDTNHTQPNFAHKGTHARTHTHTDTHIHAGAAGDGLQQRARSGAGAQRLPAGRRRLLT